MGQPAVCSRMLPCVWHVLPRMLPCVMDACFHVSGTCYHVSGTCYHVKGWYTCLLCIAGITTIQAASRITRRVASRAARSAVSTVAVPAGLGHGRRILGARNIYINVESRVRHIVTCVGHTDSLRAVSTSRVGNATVCRAFFRILAINVTPNEAPEVMPDNVLP
jgi:hypothetical protein